MRNVTPSPIEVLEAVYFAAHDLMQLAQSPTGAILRPTPSALLLMRAIDRAGQPMTIAYVAERMGYSIQNASAMVRRLVRDGWLRVVGSAKKAHEKAVELTERGLWVLDTSLDRVAPHLREATNILRSPKLRALLRYLRKLSKAAGRVDIGMDPIALGRAELGAPEMRDEEEERQRRAYLGILKLSQTWGIPLEDLRKMGHHVPDPPGQRRRNPEPRPPPPAEPSDIGDAFWNSTDDDD